MPVPAGVIRDSPVAAGGALVDMSAERRGAAALDGSPHFQMQAVEPVAVLVDETASRQAHQIGHLQGWPVHQWLLADSALSGRLVSGSRSRGLAVWLRRTLERCR